MINFSAKCNNSRSVRGFRGSVLNQAIAEFLFVSWISAKMPSGPNTDARLFMLFNLPNANHFEIPDDWWLAAGMSDFKPSSPGYPTKPYDQWPQKRAFLITPAEVEPPRRDVRFERDFGGFDRARMVSVLREIRLDVPMCALEVETHPIAASAYRVRHGFHRYYASIAVGFEKLPVAVFASLEQQLR